jgi:hypothetical protein
MDLFSALWAAVLTFYDFLRSVPTFTATLSGVLAAFGLNALARGFWNHNTRQRLRRDLRTELRGSVTRLRERGIKRIETETLYVWQLAVHSGDARFLKADERKQIAEKYFLLDNYNYEAKITCTWRRLLSSNWHAGRRVQTQVVDGMLRADAQDGNSSRRQY